MSCFDNIVGVSGTCSDTVPTSGLYLNDIDITLEELNSIVTAEYKDGEDLGNQKIAMAMKQLVNKITSHYQEKLKHKSILTGQRLGFPQDNKNLIAGTRYKGIELELCNHHSYLDLFVSKLELQVETTGDIDIKVWDLIQGKEIDSITISAVAGEIVSLDVTKVYKSSHKKLHLAFMYDATGISANNTLISSQGCTNCGSTFSRPNAFIYARGVEAADASSKIKSALISGSDTGGLSIIYSINCSREDWLCEKRNLLALPALYLAGAEIMEFTLQNTDRLNSNTTIDFARNEERMMLYGQKFERQLESVLKNMRLPDDPRCFECKRTVGNKVVLP